MHCTAKMDFFRVLELIVHFKRLIHGVDISSNERRMLLTCYCYKVIELITPWHIWHWQQVVYGDQIDSNSNYLKETTV